MSKRKNKQATSPNSPSYLYTQEKADRDLLAPDSSDSDGKHVITEFKPRFAKFRRTDVHASLAGGAEDIGEWVTMADLAHEPVFFSYSPLFPVDTASEISYEQHIREEQQLEAQSNAILESQPFSLERCWADKQINLLLFSLICTKGTDPEEIKKYRVFQDLAPSAITRQVNRLLLQLGSEQLKGIPIDPYRLQKFNNGELILMRCLKPEMWLDPYDGLLLLNPVILFDPKDAQQKQLAQKTRMKYKKNRIEFIKLFMKPSERL